MTLRPPELVVTDVDGTLLTTDHQVSPRTRRAIARARESGVSVVLATARGPAQLAPVLAQLPELADAEFIGFQGALTGRFENGSLRVAEEHVLSSDTTRAVADLAADNGFAVNFFVGMRWFASELTPEVEREAAIVQGAPDVVGSGVVDAPHKILVLAAPGQTAQLQRLALQLPADASGVFSHPRYLEITRRGVSKGTALAALCARSGVSPSAVLAIGDGMNDLPMFALAGHSAAMGNAPAEVARAANSLAPTNDHDGLAHVLEALLDQHVLASNTGGVLE